jgi:hypothetical protein
MNYRQRPAQRAADRQEPTRPRPIGRQPQRPRLQAEATNDFTDITGQFDVKEINLVVFGGQVPPERTADLGEEIGALNPRVIFVQGLAGIPGLIVNQVRGAFTATHQNPARAPSYTPDDHSIRLTLADPADVKLRSGGRPRSCHQTRRAIRSYSSTTTSWAATTPSRSPITSRPRPHSPWCSSTRRCGCR